ncbi:YkoP family protein [Neobacillus sp. SCS-31]|uniref:YkoP family protein n=1 Tax=Neobacillus oceani TaxID=3115292 RepID=UPI003905EF43
MKQHLLSAWMVLDPLYFSCTRLTYLDDTNNIFRVRLTKYKGRELLLSDGTRIAKDDVLVKIHLHNVRLLRDIYPIKSDVRRARIIYQHVLRSLPGIETFIQSHKRSEEIKGIIGITTLCKGAERLGFEVFSISNPFYNWLKWVTFLPILLLSVNGNSLQRLGKKTLPGYLVMSKDKLKLLYSSTHEK